MAKKKQSDWQRIGEGRNYFHRVHYPLQCLIFITPLMLFYQIASAIHPWTQGETAGPQVVAFILLLNFFNFFGAAGMVLPFLAVVFMLLGWHLVKKDPWEFQPKLYAAMAVESVIWGIPIFVIGLAVVRHLFPAVGATPGEPHWQDEIVLSVGAGIYEELLFRFAAMNLLSLFLIDLFEMRKRFAMPIIFIGSAILFSAYHYLGQESFEWTTFWYRTGLGIYMAGIYYWRGYGIAVGAHTVYDLLAVTYGWRH